MISLITYIDNEDMIKDVENQQIPLAKTINNYWKPIITWSTATLLISQNGLFLSIGATAILVLLILYAVYLDVNEKRSLLTLYRKLSPQNQLLIKAISNIDNNNSTEAIVTEFQKLSSHSVTELYVTQKLKEAENTGLIKQTVKNLRDNPILVWKLQLPKKNSFKNIISS